MSSVRKKCLVCRKVNHFMRMCRSKWMKKKLFGKNVRQLDDNGSCSADSDSKKQCKYVDIVKLDEESSKDLEKIMVNLKVLGEERQFRILNIQVDTGAKVNVLS